VGADAVSVLEMPSWSPVRRWRLLVVGMLVAHAPVVSRETASRSGVVRVLQECVDRADVPIAAGVRSGRTRDVGGTRGRRVERRYGMQVADWGRRFPLRIHDLFRARVAPRLTWTVASGPFDPLTASVPCGAIGSTPPGRIRCSHAV